MLTCNNSNSLLSDCIQYNFLKAGENMEGNYKQVDILYINVIHSQTFFVFHLSTFTYATEHFCCLPRVSV
jgi:hypothetical protein